MFQCEDSYCFRRISWMFFKFSSQSFFDSILIHRSARNYSSLSSFSFSVSLGISFTWDLSLNVCCCFWRRFADRCGISSESGLDMLWKTWLLKSRSSVLWLIGLLVQLLLILRNIIIPLTNHFLGTSLPMSTKWWPKRMLPLHSRNASPPSAN